MTRSWQGAAQAGSREYDDADVERVLDRLPRGSANATTMRTFADIVGMEGRQVRAILSDRDGIDYVLAYDGDLFWAAEFFEETRGWTETLRARAQTELDRVGRRERYARMTLPRRQPELMAS